MEKTNNAKTPPIKVRKRFLPSSLRFSFGAMLRVVFLVVFVILVWQVAHDRVGFDSLKTPVAYDGDSLQILGWIKASADGDYIPFKSKLITRLGAPYSANWNDHAMYEEFITFVLGRLTNWFDIFTAANVGIMASYVTSVIVFYACCRLLRHRKEWAMCCAVLFAFAYYTSHRGLPHLLLSYTFTVPLILLSCWLVLAGKRIQRWNIFWWFCVWVGPVVGFSNPYNLNIYLQLMGLSLLIGYLLHKRWANLEAGIVALLLAALAFISVNMDTISYGIAHGKNPAAMPRGYFHTEMFALKPMELIIPPSTHHSELLADIGRKYSTSAWVRGEVFSPYLGIVSIVALGWAFFEFVRFIMSRQRNPHRLPPHIPQSAYILIYSVIGGLNGVIALCGILYFRAANRYSIFISAICLLFAASVLSRVTRKWDALPRWMLASLLVGIGLWDQLPRTPTLADKIEIENAIASDRAFVQEMEKNLPPGSMVFQLPVIRFPEGGPVGAVTEYEMLRPFFFSQTLRFSFGSNQGRSRENWQFEIERMPFEDAVRRLEGYGFGAIYIDRRGVQNRGEKMITALQQMGKTRQFENSTGDLICVVLQPSQKPVFPNSDDDALIHIQKGLAIEEPSQAGTRHWMSGDATISFFNDTKATQSFIFTTTVASLTARRVVMEYAGRVIWEGEIQAGMAIPIRIEVVGKPGYNKFNVSTDKPPTSPQPNAVRISYALINPRATRVSR